MIEFFLPLNRYKNGVKVPNNHVKYFEYPIVKIETIDPEDEGLYQCLARNDYGEVSKTFYLHVRPTIMMNHAPQNAKCFPMDNNMIHVTFDKESPLTKIQYFIASDSPRDFHSQLPRGVTTKSFTIDTKTESIFRPLKPFYLYMRSMMPEGIKMVISQLSKPIFCATQGIEPKFVKAPNGIFLRWETPATDSNITGYTIQFLNNKTASPVVFQNEVVGTYVKLPTFVSWSEVSKNNVKFPARNHVKAGWTEVQVSGNVTGLYIPNADEVTVRILGSVMEGGELFPQNLDSLSWTNIKASSVSLEPLELDEVESREAKITWKGLEDISCAHMCSTLKNEIISRDSDSKLKCEKM